MSVSPAQNFSKPPPVPEIPTVIFTSGFSSRNSSAAASVSGPTVLDPSIVMLPERLLLLLQLSSPQAAMPNTSAAARATAGKTKRERTCALLFSVVSYTSIAGSLRAD